MLLKASIVLLIVMCTQGRGQDGPPAWAPELSAGRTALSTGNYAVAVERYREALAKAEEAKAAPTVLLPILKALAAALRSNSNPAGAQPIAERILTITKETQGEFSSETAAALSDLAVVQRAQDLRKEAVVTLREALHIRTRTRLSQDSARDATLLGITYHEMGEDAEAEGALQMAVMMWGALPDSGLEILRALEPLAALLRNTSRYERAEEYYLWALRLQEGALGPKASELISTLDSLAYVQFGQKKYTEAEAMYNRLLALWEMTGGPEHPMLALTLDKMAEFYIEQKRYDEAEPLAQRAMTIRAKQTIETMHRKARVLAGQQKTDAALLLYGQTVRTAADLQLADEDIPGTLTAYSVLLRQKQRVKEADAIGKRLKDAADRKGEKEGKRAVPPPPRTKG